MISCAVTPIHSVRDSPTVVSLMDLRESHMNALLSASAKIEWTTLVSPEWPIDDQWNSFINCIHELIKSHIPIHSVEMRASDKEWLTPLTKHLINERWKAFRQRNWPKFNHLKAKVKLEIAQAKSLWANKMQKFSNGLWKIVNRIQGKKNNDPIARLIEQFSNVDHLLEALHHKVTGADGMFSDESYQGGSDADDDWKIVIDEPKVENQLSRLPSKKAPGFDNIPNKIYRSMAHFIAYPLTVIFNTSVSHKVLPEAWKKGKIIPIPKSNPPSIDRIRYITLLPTPLKILEKIVIQSVSKRFQTAYGPEQHGFRCGTSTTTALLSLTDASLKCLNDPSLFGVAIANFDMTRAFDMVDCSLAVQKLSQSGFPRGFVEWVASYMSGRSGYLAIHGRYSKEVSTTRGVPQGSVLGPCLFCVYVNDLKSVSVSVTTIKYADDLSLVIPLNNSDPQNIRSIVDNETMEVESWCSENKLSLNTTKSNVLFVTRKELQFNEQPLLQRKNEIKLLGVIINEKLNWNAHVHVQYLRKRANQRMHVLRTLRPLISPHELHCVYVLLIRSLLEYASPTFVGLNKKLADILQSIDKRAHRIMAGYRSQDTPDCTCKENLEARRHSASETLFKNAEQNPEHLLMSLIPKKLPRSRHYSVPFSHSHKYHQSFFPYMARFLNEKLK